MTMGLLLEESLKKPLLQGSHDASTSKVQKNNQDIEGEPETRLWPNNPSWARVFLFMDIAPFTCFFPLFYVAQFLVVAILKKLYIDMNAPIQYEFYQMASVGFALGCGGVLMSIPIAVLVIWHNIRDLILILVNTAPPSQQKILELEMESKSANTGDYLEMSLPLIRYAFLRKVLEIETWWSYGNFNCLLWKGSWEYEIFWPKNSFEPGFVVLMIVDMLLSNFFLFFITTVLWLDFLWLFAIPNATNAGLCYMVHVFGGSLSCILYAHFASNRYNRLMCWCGKMSEGKAILWLERFAWANVKDAHDQFWADFKPRRYQENMWKIRLLRSFIKPKPREMLLDETEEYLAYLRKIVGEANTGISDFFRDASITQKETLNNQADMLNRGIMQAAVQRAFKFLRVMDAYKIDRSNSLKIMCFGIIDQIIRRDFGLLSFEDLEYIMHTLQRNEDCRTVLWDSLMEHLPDYIVKSKAAALDPLDLIHLLGRSLKIQQKQVKCPLLSHSDAILSHSDAILCFHQRFPSMMDWCHRYTTSLAVEHTSDPSCQISNETC